MDEARLRTLLDQVASGHLSTTEATDILRRWPLQPVGDFATLDTHRAVRTGFPEVIFCAGKTDEQVEAIVRALSERSSCVLATRMRQETASRLEQVGLGGTYYPLPQLWRLLPENAPPPVGKIVCCCAGTSDLPVLEEAALTAETMGSRVERLVDVGVAGIHRLLSRADVLQRANVVICVAGMEGALPSVVGGLVSAPVIAVPTSVGYGAHFGGLAPLLTMLNSCATGVTVVNIDNGFGAGYAAHLMNSRMGGPATGQPASKQENDEA